MHPHPKKIYRARRDKLLGGVCAGLADFFYIDPTWIRFCTVSVFTICLFFGKFFFPLMMVLLLYAIAWIIIPLRPPKTKSTQIKNHD